MIACSERATRLVAASHGTIQFHLNTMMSLCAMPTKRFAFKATYRIHWKLKGKSSQSVLSLHPFTLQFASVHFFCIFIDSCNCAEQCHKVTFIPTLTIQAINGDVFCSDDANKERALDPHRSSEDSYALRVKMLLEARKK